MTKQKFDTVVIGTGPGGEGAAMKLTKEGQHVAIIEKQREVGGGCTHSGTIPSKALRHAVKRLMEYNTNPLFREVSAPKHMSFPQVMRWTETVIQDQVTLRSGYYQRNEVPVLQGRAKFLDAHTLEIEGPKGKARRIEADHFILATGSRPYRPADVDFTHPRIFDSDTILSLNHTPRSMVIYGAGVIGSEYASIFRGLGVKVDLINTRERLLTFLDDEVSDALSYHLRELGVLIRHDEAYSRVEADPEGVTVHLESGKRVRRDILLWANGRTGNTQNMGLEELGVPPNGRGQVAVNENFQTEQANIYAVGDVVGYPSLASAAYDQGRFVATHILNGTCDYRLAQDIPAGIYTIPEISSVGRTERELTAAKVPYEIGHAFFKDLARGQITGQTTGMLKLLFHTETLELLGIHCFGDQASEIVHIGQAIMSQPGNANNLMYFINTTFNYPTMAEAYRVAAINGLNRLS
ncbi:NAD(P)(+) transhydrogenase [Alkalilimnicola ehrlichii]|uniref:Soluble pyridine nucleotide transhydrogenase n=1 Tax=Alkalilimnicola ehrlichii TaxID=351052 RepID=A0A3E0X2E6_9GAMM|nr:Si-specific NAD(P)(+) transhydrogenase [Alkalilimnicola ehrlichii]RFA28382.1 NAD(P)(+) transhydrogenase [Alkalilimnicola ehrlichii]RFA38553.1 NAD(P)(+) transhydrogenase [Alkalilimnicola ehrlichii]